MNKTELKSRLDKKTKEEIIEIILNLHTRFPRLRQDIYNLVSPPVINWEALYDECMGYVISASMSNKIGRINVPSLALEKFGEFTPDEELTQKYIYESFEVLTKGLLALKYRDSFNYSWVGGYGYECKKSLKKRKLYGPEVDRRLTEIVAKYFNPDSDAYEYILLTADIKN